jgi:putative oxidoreductase
MMNLGLFGLRVGPAAIMLLAHGWPKLEAFSERMHTFPDPLGVGSPASLALVVFAEVICAGLLILGIATRLSAVPLLITMLVAAFVIHAQDPFAKQELGIFFGLIFAVLTLTGGGTWGFGEKLRNRWLRCS